MSDSDSNESMLCVTNIQRFSIHDGKGIRTTIFFKGCPLNCAWCHNPETKAYGQEYMFYKERCIRCGTCNGLSMADAVEECLGNAREMCGKMYSIDALIKEVSKDIPFYEESGGGVTLSGGEVLSQNISLIQELVKKLSGAGISVNIDTCGEVPYENIEKVIPYSDTFLYDIKCMDEKLHMKYTGASNRRILENLAKLSRTDAAIWLRLPVIPQVNDTDENVESLINYMREEKIMPQQINLLPYHEMGRDKCERLGKKLPLKFEVPDEKTLERMSDFFNQAGYGNVYIGG